MLNKLVVSLSPPVERRSPIRPSEIFQALVCPLQFLRAFSMYALQQVMWTLPLATIAYIRMQRPTNILDDECVARSSESDS